MNTNASIMRVLAGVIYISAISLLILGAAAYFFSPAYEKGLWSAIEAFRDVLLVAVGVKGGAAIGALPTAPTAPPEEKPTSGGIVKFGLEAKDREKP